MSDPQEDELNAYADDSYPFQTLVAAAAPEVRNVHSTCNVLWVPRAVRYDVAALRAVGTANVAASILKQASNGARWLGAPGKSHVLSMSWSKDVDSPAGVFSISLKPPAADQTSNAQGYLDNIRPSDLLFIYSSDDALYDADPFEGTLLTVGIVDRVQRDTALSNGTEVETISLTGRDLGAIFQDTQTVFDQSFANIENVLFSSAYMQQLFARQAAASPVENVLTLLDLIYNKGASGSQLVGTQFLLHAGGNEALPLAGLIDVTTYVQAPMFGYTLGEPFNIAQAGNVWSLLTSYANQVVNEFFVDVRDFEPKEMQTIDHLADLAREVVSDGDAATQASFVTDFANRSFFANARANYGLPGYGKTLPVVALVFRQRPYDRDTFNLLPVIDLQDVDIENDTTGLSSHDVYNFFKCRFPSLSNEYQELLYGIHINKQSVARFGLRRMEAETRYMFGSSFASASYEKGKMRPQDFSSIFDWYCGLLSVWYAANEQMFSGSVTIRYRPDIRCGTRVRIHRTANLNGKRRIFEFYVQGVSQSFSSQAGASRTTLTLTRGVNFNAAGALANNLVWKGNGAGIPRDLDPYGRFTSGGFDFSSGAVQVINQQRNG